MRAIISGQADMAFVDEGTYCFVVSSDSPDLRLRCTQDAALRLFGDASDLTTVEADSIETVLVRLEKAWRENRSLHIVLTLLNSEEVEGIRLLSAECLDEFLEHSH